MKSSILYSVDKINRKLEAVNTPVFEVADSCAEADGTVKTAAEKEEFFSKLKIDKSMFSKYVKIGKNKFIRKYLSSLPLSFTTLYFVACLTEDDLKAGIKEGVINPSATRQAVQAWISQRRKDLDLLDRHEATADHAVEFGEKSRDLLLRVDDLDDDRQVFGQILDLGSMYPARMAEAHWAAQDRCAGEMLLPGF